MNKPSPTPVELKFVLAGLGGQGVVFLTRLLAQTAIAMDYPVMVSETHGMSQRGGSVVSHLKIGGNQAPLIRQGTADALLSLEPSEALRNLLFIRPGGVAFVNAENGFPEEVTAHLDRLNIQVCRLPASQIAVQLGAAAVANVALAGFAVAHQSVPLPVKTVQDTLKNIVKRGLDINLQALEAGFQAGRDLL